jgi:pimeloyl-ACP methyl ester carboxylesterase
LSVAIGGRLPYQSRLTMEHDNLDDERRIEHRIRANGLDHRVLAWEPARPRPTGGTAFLLHGYMDAAATWEKIARRLAGAGLRVLAPDLRGYGDSARTPPGSYYHFPDYIADVADLVDQLAPGAPLLLVGHSMGGTVASLYAGAFPERVTRLALLEGIGPPDTPFDSMPDRMRSWIDQTRALRERGEGASKILASREDALRRLSGNHRGVPAEILAAHVDELLAVDGAGRLAWKGDPLHKPMSPMPFFAQGYIAFARRVTCPTLYVSGGPRGFHLPDEDARLGAFAKLERFEIADAGHMMHWTRPDALAERLLAFWG